MRSGDGPARPPSISGVVLRSPLLQSGPSPNDQQRRGERRGKGLKRKFGREYDQGKSARKGEMDPSERASHWISSSLAPVFDFLVNDLGEKGYKASLSKQTDQSLTLSFSKGGNRFEYTISCVIRPTPIPNWPEGHVDLVCYRRVNNRGLTILFRNINAEYDIEDVGEKEIVNHFHGTFRLWLSRE